MIKKNSTGERNIYYTCVVLVVLAVIAMVTSIFPACFPDDSVNILNDIFNHDRWRDWHPVTYYLFLRGCMSVYHNPYAVIWAQGIIAILTQYMILRYLYHYISIKACLIYTLLLFTLGIASFEYVIILFKDTPYSYGMIAFTVSIIYGIKEGWKKRHVFFLSTVGVFTSMMRHGGWVSLTAGLVILSIYYLNKKSKDKALKVLLAAVIICTVFNMMRYSLIKKYDVEKNPAYVTYTVPLYMLATYTEHSGIMDTQITSFMEELAPMEEWKVRYNRDKYLADTVARDDLIVEHVDDKGMHYKIIKANARYFITEPGEYLKNFFTINNLVWSPTTPDDGYIAYMPTLGSGPYVEKKFPEWSTRIYGLGSVVKRLFEDIKNTKWKCDLSYRGGTAFLITVLSFAILLIRQKTEMALAYMPIAVYVFMIMISIPQQDTRYVLPLIMFGCLAPVTLMERIP